MTLRHMQIFLAVANCKNMSVAARQLYIAQPTVSQAIGEIETFYGVKLFERLNKKLFITHAGEKLLPYAQSILNLNTEMNQSMDLLSKRKIIKVGATITVGTCILANIVNKLESTYQDMGIEVLVDNTKLIENLLLGSKLDIALVEGQIKSPDLIVTPAIKDDLVLVCGLSHPFASKESISINELHDQAFILRENGSGTRETFDDVLEKHKISVYTKWTCHSSDAILSAVESGQGLTAISHRLVMSSGKSKNLCIIPIKDISITRFFSLVHHKNKFLSEPINNFINEVIAINNFINEVIAIN